LRIKKPLVVEVQFVPISKEETERRMNRLSELLFKGAKRLASKEEEQKSGDQTTINET
jgi:cob(I)alamin adenosyltransferase